MSSDTKIVGILNITPDSFSDGGQNFSYESSLNNCEKMIDDGASVIDIGAESTRPNATLLSHEEEWERLYPILDDAIKCAHLRHVQVSVDTRHPENAEKAIDAGADWINDVSGLKNPRMLSLLKDSDAKIVLMHNMGVPADKNITLPEHCEAVHEVAIWAKIALYNLDSVGIDASRVIVDPGIGFGKTQNQSFDIIKEIASLDDLGCEILVGHSRKSFFDMFTDKNFADRDVETIAASLFLAQNNVEFLRVHNVEHHVRALNIFGKLAKKSTSE